MNALAGGGSFVSLPALIAAGLPSAQANASSTVALLPGGLVSALVYRARWIKVGDVPLRWLLPITLAGGCCGALLFLRTPTPLFDFILPWLLLAATLALAFGRWLGEALRRSYRLPAAPVLCLQFALGVYGGYFGGAVGIMMLATWGLLDRVELSDLHAPRTLLVSATNLTASFLFIAAGAVRWPEMFLLCVGAIFGGFAGAHLGRRLPPRTIRGATLILTAAITILFFVRKWIPR